MVWYSHIFKNVPLFVVIHTLKDLGVVNKTEVDIFLELSCFFDNPMDVGNLISGFSAFSKSSLNIWKFTVHVLLKSGLENFEHYFPSMWGLQWALAAQLVVGQVHGTLHLGQHPLLLPFGDAPKTHSCDRMRAVSGSSHAHSHVSLPSS